MSFIERVMRVMAHINIGAALGLAAWVLWSGWQVVTGLSAPAYRAAEVKALMNLAHSAQSAPMRLVPARPGTPALASCHAQATAPKPAAVVLTGADL